MAPSKFLTINSSLKLPRPGGSVVSVSDLFSSKLVKSFQKNIVKYGQNSSKCKAFCSK